MSDYSTAGSKYCRWVVIFVPCFIIRVFYKLNVFILISLSLGSFFTWLILLLAGTFFIIKIIAVCVLTVGNNVSLLANLMVGYNFLPNLIVLVIVTFCDLLRKCESICLWGGFTWLNVSLLTKKPVWINHVFRVVIICIGAIVTQFFNKSAISISITMKNDGTYQVLLLVCLLYNLFIVWVEDILAPS